jgi:hypothetical protein
MGNSCLPCRDNGGKHLLNDPYPQVGIRNNKAFRTKGSRKNNFTFSHPGFRPSSADLPSRNPQNNPLFLRFRSLRSTKSDLNLSENSAKLFLREP